jgi:hypothetical protein
MALERTTFGPFTLTLLSEALTLVLCYGFGGIVDAVRSMRPARSPRLGRVVAM